MKRYDWTTRLYGVVEEHRARTFEWGRNDCCLFVARAVDAMTAWELEQQIGSQYSDEASALRLIAAHGGLAGAVSAFMGEGNAGRATRGDVVLFDGGEGEALGICLGKSIAAMGQDGLRFVERADAAITFIWPV